MARPKRIEKLEPAVGHEILIRLLAAHPELTDEVHAIAQSLETFPYYEVEVSLRQAEPRIWRRILIAENATFLDLHEAIQDACVWLNYHLFMFRDEKAGADLAGLPGDDFDDQVTPDAAEITLKSYFGSADRASCSYEYDFGDSWHHDLIVRAVRLPERFKRRLVAGERAFPPEDCGGIDGYEKCAIAARTGRDPDPDEGVDLLRWLGGWHPDRFDLTRAKKAFDRPRQRVTARVGTARDA